MASIRASVVSWVRRSWIAVPVNFSVGRYFVRAVLRLDLKRVLRGMPVHHRHVAEHCNVAGALPRHPVGRLPGIFFDPKKGDQRLNRITLRLAAPPSVSAMASLIW